MAAAASSASKKKTTKTAATKPRAQRARSKPPKLSPRDVFWRRVLQWLLPLPLSRPRHLHYSNPNSTSRPQHPQHSNSGWPRYLRG